MDSVPRNTVTHGYCCAKRGSTLRRCLLSKRFIRLKEPTLYSIIRYDGDGDQCASATPFKDAEEKHFTQFDYKLHLASILSLGRRVVVVMSKHKHKRLLSNSVIAFLSQQLTGDEDERTRPLVFVL